MSDSAALVPIDDDPELPEQIWRLRLEGNTNARIARKLMISVPEVHAALDKILPVLDHRYRKQAISEALLILDTITGVHMKNVADPESASVLIRTQCERRFWLGITGSSDPLQLVQQSKQVEGETSMSAYKRGLRWIEKMKLLERDGKPDEPVRPSKPDDPISDDPPK